MEAFNNAINSINGVIWSAALIVILLAAGIYFSIRTKFIQFRRFGEMWKLIGEKNEESKESGLTPFQAFATTVGARVGMGNIAGVATAIFFGGPGAVVWMWITALIGAVTAVVESTLGQAYKERNMGEFIGGPQYYIAKGLHCKPLAIGFAIAAIVGPGLLMPAMQTHSTAVAIQDAFGAPLIATGVVLCIVLGLVIFGGIQRIGKIAETLAPIMCGVYLLCGLIIMFTHLAAVPHAFALMFKAAFGQETMYAGIVGAMIAWGVKRGLFSNEAGQGSGPIVSSAAKCSHPVKQGLIQGLSVYIDTLLICSITGISIMVTGFYNVSGNAEGTSLITNGIPGVEYGVSWMNRVMTASLGGSWAGMLLAVLITIFVFTTLMAYYYQAESGLRYLTGESKVAVNIFRTIFLVANFFGVIVNGQVIWSMGDTGAGLMAWFNLIAIILMAPMAIRIINDYEKQRHLGLEPMFDPATVGLEDKEGIWASYVEKKKARGDYENQDLGYQNNSKRKVG